MVTQAFCALLVPYIYLCVFLWPILSVFCITFQSDFVLFYLFCFRFRTKIELFLPSMKQQEFYASLFLLIMDYDKPMINMEVLK
jgi:hypothetical protein